LLAFTFAFVFTFYYNLAHERLWVVIGLHAGINAGDNTYEVLFPGLADLDWQIPAYVGMLVMSIVLGFITWRRNRSDRLVVTAVG
jgi:membrane protease YdiL (CAAX protease family)